VSQLWRARGGGGPSASAGCPARRTRLSPAPRSSRQGSRFVPNMPPVQIGVGMLGYAFMGKAHSLAFPNVRRGASALVAKPRARASQTVRGAAWPPPLQPRLVAIAGRNEDAVAEAASRYGY